MEIKILSELFKNNYVLLYVLNLFRNLEFCYIKLNDGNSLRLFPNKIKETSIIEHRYICICQ